MQVVWTAAAARGVWGAYQYLNERNPRAARDLAEALYAAGDSLADLPNRGAQSPAQNAGACNRPSLYHPLSGQRRHRGDPPGPSHIPAADPPVRIWLGPRSR
jgi:plasmid stabilization system protein ParE